MSSIFNNTKPHLKTSSKALTLSLKNLRSSKKKALRVAAVVADVEQAMWMEFFSWWKTLEPFE